MVIAGIAVVLLCGLIFGVSLMNGMRLNRKIAMPEETIADVIILQETVPIELESPPAFSYTYAKRKTGVTITGFEGKLPSEVEIPAEIDGLPVTSIGNYAFYECTNLSNISIPDNVTSVGSYTFYKCTSLSNITIPDSVTSIGACAFFGCENLNSIVIPRSVTRVGEYAFRACEKLSSVTINRNCTVGIYAFPSTCQVYYY